MGDPAVELTEKDQTIETLIRLVDALWRERLAAHDFDNQTGNHGTWNRDSNATDALLAELAKENEDD